MAGAAGGREEAVIVMSRRCRSGVVAGGAVLARFPFIVLLALTAFLPLLAGPVAAAERVLVIDQEGQTRPAFVQFMEGFRAGLAEQGAGHDVFIENLDLARLDRSPDDPQRRRGGSSRSTATWPST